MKKNSILYLANMFAMISTSIFLFSGIFIAVFWGFDTHLDLSYVFAVLGLSFVFTILYIPVRLSENWNVSKGISFGMRALYFALVNVTVMVTGFLMEWFAVNNMKMIIGFEITIIIVYCTVVSLEWYSAKNIANKMNDRLREISEK